MMYNIFKATKLIITLLLLMHIFSCFWVLIALNSKDQGWMSGIDWKNDKSNSYTNAFYFIVQTFTTVGYGDYGAKSEYEMWYLMFIELVGVMVFGAIMGELQTFRQIKSLGS
jgi:hypothetical protein